MYREDRRGDEGGPSGNDPLQCFEQQNNRGEMQKQVDSVIAAGILATQPLIKPEGDIRERTNFKRAPQAARKQRVIVEMKRAPPAAAKCDDSGEKENHGLARNEKPPKRVVRPKNAAERAARIKNILTLLDEMYPKPTVPLAHRDAWQLLVATILSAQCTDKRVNEVTPGLFKKYPTIRDLANANQPELAQDIRSTGFFNNKSKSLIGAARKILTDFGGVVPNTMDQLLTVPGAARKTANVVLGAAFHLAAGVVVDTHVLRLSRRLDLTKHADPVKIEQDLMKIIPKEKWIEFPLQLIYHGRALCVARKPRCAQCKLDPLCYAKDKTN
jgi:endonuclease III